MALITGLILAGGASRRMGQPKALIEWEGEAFVMGLVRQLRAAGCAEVVVVSGAHRAAIAGAVRGARVVWAEGWRAGMRASLRVGLRAAGPGPVLLTHCDRPRAAPATWARLARLPDGCPWVPTHGGRPGHPVRLPAWLRGRLLWADAVPLRDILQRAGARRLAVPDPWVLVNLNRPDQVERLRAGALQPRPDETRESGT